MTPFIIYRYNKASVNAALLMHNVRDWKDAVANEKRWFESRTKWPQSIRKKLSRVDIMAFMSLVHNHAHAERLVDLDMTSTELARVCSQRYLSDLHLSWVAGKLNAAQSRSFVIMINFISNVESFCERRIESRELPPDNLIFMINVGKRSGSDTTYLGTNQIAGSHWSLTFYRSSTNSVLYGDSLGWPPPGELLNKMNLYLRKVGIRSKFQSFLNTFLVV